MGSHAKRSLVGCACVLAVLFAAGSAQAATVSLTLTGAGDGTVTSSKGTPPLNCSIENGGPQSGQCTSSFGNGETVTLTATAKDKDSVFAGWTVGAGSCTGSATTLNPRSPCEFTTDLLGGATSLTAKFVPTPDPPVVSAGPSAPGPNSLLLSLPGTVNPEGFAVSECSFEYDTEPYEPGENPHGTALPCVPPVLSEGGAPVPVNSLVELEQLVPASIYHYRLRATNLGGVGEGADRTFVTPPGPPDLCANSAIRKTQPLGAIMLPGCMALEQVSPPLKDNQPASGPMVSDSGGRVRFKSSAALAGSPATLYLGGEPYVASRTATGWQTVPTRTPAEMTRGWFGGARSFSPDLSSWLHLAGTQPQGELGVGQAFTAGIGGLFEPLSPLLEPLSGGVPDTLKDAALQGASADRSHLYFNPAGSAAYLPGDPTPSGTVLNGYVAHLDSSGEPDLELLARDEVGSDTGKVWGGECGARIAGSRGAISADGLHSFISTRPTQPPSGNCSTANKVRILERTETPAGTQIAELIQNECDRISPACSTADGDDTYLGASLDQSKVYFASARQLADTDLDTTSDVYLYDAGKAAGSRVSQISAGGTGDATPGAGANVSALAAVSGDGSHAYFTSNDVLTTDKGPGNKEAEAGKPNLYLYRYPSGQITFIATLLSANGEGAYPVPLIGANPLVGGDGHVLLFNAKASLVANDTDAGRRDVYRYDASAATPTLECISCRPGGPDAEPFDVDARSGPSNTGTEFAEVGRWVSEDGQTVVLKTTEGLLPGDANGVLDSYLWREGQLYRLPGTTDPEGTLNPDRGLGDNPTLSHEGSEVAYQSTVELLAFDRDSTKDVYAAREGGGFPVPPPPHVCVGEECQQPFVAQPPNQSAGSEDPGPGNPPPSKGQGNRKSCPQGKRKVTRNGKAHCAKRHRKLRRHRRAVR